jgi:hypothetical protein
MILKLGQRRRDIDRRADMEADLGRAHRLLRREQAGLDGADRI